MSTKKISLEYLLHNIEKEAIKNTETLESRLEMVKNKIKTNKNRTKNRKFHLKVFELNIKLAVLEDSENEIQNRLDIEKNKLWNT